MLGRLAGATLILLLAWSGSAQALGLGDIRLESALNEPFRAEIELLSVTPEELEGLTVRLAPTDTFRRYGIERPSFLSGFSFEIRALPGERGVVRVTSRDPVTEPFVTFLAEATWPRGRLLREYTVLLDPPTFAGGESDAVRQAPVQAPAAPSGRSADTGSFRRAPERSPRQTAPSSAPSIGSGDTYRVQRSETLWGIAERVRPAGSGLTMNQVMVALYENNPEAFDGNINRLREGAVLRIPAEDALYGINRSEAIAEVSRQNRAWREGESAGSLRLVPPEEAPETAAMPAAGGGTAGGGTPAGADRVRRLEAELAERERQLAIRNQELADLRQQLAASEDAAETPPAPAEQEPAAAAPGVDLEAEGEAAADEGEIFAETGAAGAGEGAEEAAGGAGTADEEAAAEAPAPARTTPAVVTSQPEEDGGIMGLLGGLLGSIWTYVGLGVVVVGLLLLVLARRRGGEVDDSTGTWQALDDEFEDDDEREATERLRALASEDDSILVVEKEEPAGGGAAAAGVAGAAAAGAAAAAAADRSDARRDEQADTGASSAYSLEDTFSSETAINLDQSDPLAEADFHMAYGLYDQAADLIRNAISADPDRTDLKAKLAEVYFVWGNKDAFVDAAENLNDALGADKDADWDKIVIMGQQIAPEHELFAGAAAAGGGDVDLSFDEESGVGTLDVDFGSEDEDEMDLAFGGGEDSGDADLQGTSGGLDFVLDETGERTGTNEMLIDPSDLAETGEYHASGEDFSAEEPTQESPTLETPFEEQDTQESPTLETPFEEEDTRESPTLETPFGDAEEAPDDEITQETPTIETWGLGEDETTELPVSSEDEQRRSEQTAEIDLDDLGLDLDGLEESGERSATVLQFHDDEESGADEGLLDRTGETQVLSDDDATLLAPGRTGADESGDDDATMLAPSADPDFAETEALDEREQDEDTGATGRMPRPGAQDVDVDLDDLTAAIKQSDLGDLETPRDEDDTVEQPTSTDATGRFSTEVFDDDELDSILDLDVGEDLAEEDDAPTDTALRQGGEGSEGRTQTEVGTKLDLARAYVDMGDPEGARSILQEVLEEGDEGQRQEANRLLDALPDE